MKEVHRIFIHTQHSDAGLGSAPPPTDGARVREGSKCLLGMIPNPFSVSWGGGDFGRP
jgi:hypothetical protein